jgi:hypothetical protein
MRCEYPHGREREEDVDRYEIWGERDGCAAGDYGVRRQKDWRIMERIPKHRAPAHWSLLDWRIRAAWRWATGQGL